MPRKEGRADTDNRPSLGAWVDDAWWPTLARRNKAATLRSDRILLDKHLLPAFGSRPLPSITRGMIAVWFDHLSQSKPCTANRSLKMLRRILGHAVKANAIPDNPSMRIKLNSIARRRQSWNAEEKERILEALDGVPSSHRARSLLVKMLLFTSCKGEDILKLRWTDVGDRKLVLGGGDSGRYRIAIGPEAIAALEEASKLRERTGNSRDPVFPSPNDPGQPVSRQTLGKHWRMILDKAGLEGLRIHAIRQEYGSGNRIRPHNHPSEGRPTPPGSDAGHVSYRCPPGRSPNRVPRRPQRHPPDRSGDTDGLHGKDCVLLEKQGGTGQTGEICETSEPETAFEAVAELAMQRLEANWKPSTRVSNRNIFQNDILPYFMERRIDQIDRADVERWFSGLSGKAPTANRASTLLSPIMNQAEEMGLRPEGSNPVSGLRKYRLQKKERVLTPVEMGRLGTALEEHREWDPIKAAMLLLIIHTGCRLGEAVNLEWSDYRDGNLHLPDSKTGPKTVFLSRQAREVLEGVQTPRPGRVFSPMRQSHRGISLDFFWQSVRRAADLEDVRIHDLRHNYASTAIKEGVGLKTVGTLLGHRIPETTLKYIHYDDDAMQGAAEAVCEAFSRKRGERA